MTKKCANPKCDVEFTPRAANQKFHSGECCKIMTNARLMEKYYEDKARKSGATRLCHSCSRPLSRYNETRQCGGCDAKNKATHRMQLMELIAGA